MSNISSKPALYVSYKMLGKTEDGYGDLTIWWNDERIIEIKEDSLFSIIQNLCFDAIPKVVTDSKVRVYNFTYEGHITLELVNVSEGELDMRVQFAGSKPNYCSVVRPKQATLLDALYDCGVCFIDEFKGNPNIDYTVASGYQRRAYDTLRVMPESKHFGGQEMTPVPQYCTALVSAPCSTLGPELAVHTCERCAMHLCEACEVVVHGWYAADELTQHNVLEHGSNPPNENH